jgi:hypothetical protein
MLGRFRRIPQWCRDHRAPPHASLPQVMCGGVLRSSYHDGMASFTLDGQSYEYLRPDPGHPAEETRSWEYGKYPKVMASVPLDAGAAMDVYAVAERWNLHTSLWPGRTTPVTSTGRGFQRGTSGGSRSPNGTLRNTVAVRRSCAPFVGAPAYRASCQPGINLRGKLRG